MLLYIVYCIRQQNITEFLLWSNRDTNKNVGAWCVCVLVCYKCKNNEFFNINSLIIDSNIAGYWIPWTLLTHG